MSALAIPLPLAAADPESAPRLRVAPAGGGTLALVVSKVEGVPLELPLTTASGLRVVLRLRDMGDGTCCLDGGGAPS
ncbi:hypothetical protein RQ831_20555 [Roseomonas gilardii]|uniref:Secreted protein n=1 Tax=Roseomonas gilardii TaxID=257708 RepID=A0ABU3MKV8_9PROT|nr:hypothetical protein [Roseomonas gilardii]MDT8333447.1 hypothetical protein [Roseomonas gilardii]